MRRVLIQCGDLLENQRRISYLATDLRVHGYEPVILHYNPHFGSYFNARGFTVANLNCYRKGVTGKDVSAAGLPEGFWDDDSHPIYRRKAELTRSAETELEKELYMLRRDGVASMRLLEDFDVDGMIVWNGVTGHTANALRIIGNDQGKVLGYLERGFFGDSVFFDQSGTNGASALANGTIRTYSGSVDEFAYKLSRLAKEKYIKRTPRTRSRPEERGIRYLFVPLQVQLDSNIILYSGRIRSMRQAVLEALDICRELGDDWRVLVRDHPEEINQHLNIPVDSRLIRNNTMSLEECISLADAVYTVNSSVGLTAARLGRVVVCAGEGIYCREPFVIEAQNMGISQIASELNSAILEDVDLAPVANYIGLLWRHHTAFDAKASLGFDEQFSPIDVLPNVGAALNEKAKPRTQHLYDRVKSRIEGGTIAVRLEVSPANRVSLSYRKHDQPVSKEFIFGELTSKYGEQFVLEGSSGAGGYNRRVCICPKEKEDFSAEYSQFDAVLDEYCEPHRSFYKS